MIADCAVIRRRATIRLTWARCYRCYSRPGCRSLTCREEEECAPSHSWIACDYERKKSVMALGYGRAAQSSIEGYSQRGVNRNDEMDRISVKLTAKAHGEPKIIEVTKLYILRS